MNYEEHKRDHREKLKLMSVQRYYKKDFAKSLSRGGCTLAMFRSGNRFTEKRSSTFEKYLLYVFELCFWRTSLFFCFFVFFFSSSFHSRFFVSLSCESSILFTSLFKKKTPRVFHSLFILSSFFFHPFFHHFFAFILSTLFWLDFSMVSLFLVRLKKTFPSQFLSPLCQFFSISLFPNCLFFVSSFHLYLFFLFSPFFSFLFSFIFSFLSWDPWS